MADETADGPGKGKTLISEGIDANYYDMINYSVFAMIHLK